MIFKRIPLYLLLVAASFLATSGARGEVISLARIPHIYDIAIDPAKPDHLILATPRGLYRLTPDIVMQPLLDDTHDVTGLVVSDNGKFLLVSGKKNDKPFGVLFSADAGKTWKPQSTSDGGPVAFRLMKLAGSKGHMLAVSDGLFLSKNAGKNWSNVAEMPAGSLALSADRKDARQLLTATYKGLKSSSDGGKEWKPVAVGPADKPASMVARDGRNKAFAFIVSAGLYARTGSRKWEKRADAKLFDGALIHLTGSKAQPEHLIAVTQYMKLLQSRDGGATWQSFGK
jgi:hypothetical protein